MAGIESYSNTYIPKIWSTKLKFALFAQLTLTHTTNTDFEGEIAKFGDSVLIRDVPNLEVFDYVAGAGLPKPQRPKPALIALEINKGKGFHFEANMVETAQMDIDFVDKFTQNGGEQLKQAIEQNVYSVAYADAAAENCGATAGKKTGYYNMGTGQSPKEIDGGTVIDWLGDACAVLDEQNVPTEGRFALIPAWLQGKIKTSELKAVYVTGDAQSMIRTGNIGMIHGFNLFMSNNLYMETVNNKLITNVIAGNKSAIGFATQLTANEKIDNPNDFGKLIRALQVYGFKTVRPECLVHACVTRKTA